MKDNINVDAVGAHDLSRISTIQREVDRYEFYNIGTIQRSA